ncbi:hypothetical protein HMPREF3191_01603 [Veillonellaceae bacterium DNF00626]|nr:hypothetical protein HMPREF3191_01603 [Veillonellaceae bacterium DNF00626]
MRFLLSKIALPPPYKIYILLTYRYDLYPISPIFRHLIYPHK